VAVTVESAATLPEIKESEQAIENSISSSDQIDSSRVPQPKINTSRNPKLKGGDNLAQQIRNHNCHNYVRRKS